MKNIKKHPVLWSFIASLIIVFIINPDTGATLMLVYFFIGMFWLLGKAIKATKQKRSKKAPPLQTARPVVQQSQTIRKSELDVQRDAFMYQKESGNIAYFYTDVGVYVPDVNRLNNPEAQITGAVVFAKEPNNPHDHNAVLVCQSIGPIGYLYRGNIQSMVNDWLDSGKQVFGYISYLNKSHPNINKDGIKIDIAFYN